MKAAGIGRLRHFGVSTGYPNKDGLSKEFLQAVFFIALPLCLGGPAYVMLKPDLSSQAVKTQQAVDTDEAAGRAATSLQEGYRYWKGGDTEAALKAFDLAAEQAPDDPQVYYYRGIALADAGYTDDAKADFVRVAELKPDYFDAYLRLDRLYTKEKDWDTIIRYWTQFLSHDPTHTRALMERGGAYFQSGNLTAALADVKAACDLGDEAGCRYYRKYHP